ncbi:hypothetical protein ACM39_08935 [Chryseobacterium sp. FH2]|nr:hypothetical protein ACM39_08935 [Chryseobacterium sp. FH2]
MLGRVRILEIESSGMVLSVKSYRPFITKRVLPVIEFPLHSLQSFSLKGTLLLISLKRENGKMSKLRVRLNLLKKKDLKALKKHLSQYVKING